MLGKKIKLTHPDCQWDSYRRRAERTLEARLAPGKGVPVPLNDAMRYVCLKGGKRFRALLVYACGELAGAELAQLDLPACAVEMIHAYSLVHDDLPAMDDDMLRRGKPTCHIAFDEATAILAGDALQAEAFSVLSEDRQPGLSDGRRLRMVAELAHASGCGGMVGGQMLDMKATGQLVDAPHLAEIHRLKTGALIRASAILGGLASEKANDVFLTVLCDFATILGLIFQIVDDILDATASNETLGKPAGSDERMQKTTYVSLLGLEAARQEAEKLSGQAIDILHDLDDDTTFLEHVTKFVLNRSY